MILYPTISTPDDGIPDDDEGYSLEDLRPPPADTRGPLTRAAHWILALLLKHLGKRG